MKKISLLKSLLFACLLCTFISAAAQSESSYASLTSSKKKIVEIGDLTAVSGTKETALITLNSTFPDATEISWYNMAKDLLYVAFNTPGKTNRAMFDKKGKMLYNISYYSKEMLPVSVLQKVKDNYYGKSIFGIIEISYNQETVYELVLEGKTTWTNIKIVGNEIMSEKVWRKAKP